MKIHNATEKADMGALSTGKALRRTILSALTVLAVTFGGQVAGGPVNPPCDEVSGTFRFTSFTFLNPDLTEATAVADILMNGIKVGTAEAHYLLAWKGNGNGVIQATFSHDWTFLDGSTIHSQDEGNVTLEKNKPGWGLVNSRLHIVQGTGLLAGATGLVHTHGEVNLFTLEGGIDFKGQICVP